MALTETNKRGNSSKERRPKAKRLAQEIERVITAFEIGDQKDVKTGRTIVFGRHRAGREIVEEPQPHLPHLHTPFVYFYERVSEDDPKLSSGIFVAGNSIHHYTVEATEDGEQIFYSGGDSAPQIQDLLASFRQMPHFPGDLRNN